MSSSPYLGSAKARFPFEKKRKISRIRETKHLLPVTDSSTDNKKNPASKAKSAKKQPFFARQFYTLYEQKFSNLRPLLSITFPQGKDSKNLKSLGNGLWEGGAKRPLNGVRKCDGQPYKHTNIQTFQLVESIGPEGPCFENIYLLNHA